MRFSRISAFKTKFLGFRIFELPVCCLRPKTRNPSNLWLWNIFFQNIKNAFLVNFDQKLRISQSHFRPANRLRLKSRNLLIGA